MGLGGAAIAAAFLVPDARSFSRYVRTRQAGPKGLLTGGLAWLQHRTGVRSSFKNCVVCSVATLGSRTFLGAFKTWIELPELPRSFPTRLGEILPADAEGAGCAGSEAHDHERKSACFSSFTLLDAPFILPCHSLTPAGDIDAILGANIVTFLLLQVSACTLS